MENTRKKMCFVLAWSLDSHEGKIALLTIKRFPRRKRGLGDYFKAKAA